MQRAIRIGRNSMMGHLSFTAITALGLVLAGCGNEGAVGDTPLESVEQDALGTNALGTNALGTNALGTNALGTNALGTNALGTNALGTNGLNWLHESTTHNADRAQLLKYLTKCALGPTQFLPAHAAHSGCVGYPAYYGMYGLAPNWPTQAMSDIYDQRWVTACVLAHVNQKGTAQAIALHGANAAFNSVSAERATMYASEGSYWGNIFRTEQWKNVCYNNGRSQGADSPHGLDIILGRSCPDDGCGVMTTNGNCPTTGNSPSGTNDWYNYNGLYNQVGYSRYGYTYQPSVPGSTIPNINGYFPTVTALSPVSLEFEGTNGTLGTFPQGCFGDSVYNDGNPSVAISTIAAGSGALGIGDCTSTSVCAGGDSTQHPNGQKLRGLPSGMRLRYSFLTSQAVGSQSFYLKVRYAALGSGVQARIGINGSVLTTVTFPSTSSTNWDSYNTIWWNVPFVAAPSSLVTASCPSQIGLNGKGKSLTSAVYLDVELQPGATFPDLDSIRLEPAN